MSLSPPDTPVSRVSSTHTHFFAESSRTAVQREQDTVSRCTVILGEREGVRDVMVRCQSNVIGHFGRL